MSRLTAELRTLYSLAWPVTLGQVAMMSMAAVDAALVGRLDAAQMASVTLGATWQFGVMVLAMGILFSLDPLFSQAHGAGDRVAAGNTLRHGLALVALLTPPAMGLVWLAPYGLALLGQPAELVPIASRYARIVVWAMPATLTFAFFRIFLQSRGAMRPATVAILIANVANGLLGYAFVFGKWGAPALGAAGTAVATLGCSYLQLAVLLGLSWPSVRETWRAAQGGFLPARVGSLLRGGVPVGLQVATEAWAFQVVGYLAGLLGTLPLAAHGIVLNLSSLSFMVPLGVSTAAATRVGNLLGAGQPWGVAARAALLLGVGAMSASAVAFWTVPRLIVGVYTTEQEVLALAASLLPIAACFQLFDGTQVTCFGILRGAGDIRVGALVNLAGFWLVGLPLGAWLAWEGGYGVHGLWAGLATGLATVAGLLLLRVRWTHAMGGFRLAGGQAGAPPVVPAEGEGSRRS